MISRPPQIRPTHLLRLAVAYVRQSSPRQVLENFASADLQRELVGYLRAWGWRDEQIVVLDCDLGFSASVAGQRGGLFWLIDQCEQDRVGIVMVLEDNRLSRNRPDFVAFSEVARVHDVLWATQQQVFDLNDPHSEFVSSIMQDSAVLKSKLLFYNLREGKVRKARKGVSATAPPVGYVRQRSGAWTKHPDAAVRDVITRVFEKIFELGTGRSVVRYFRRNGDKLPRQGRAGQIRWVDATLGIVGLMFHNEAYAGTYVFRKRIVDPRLPRLKNGHHRTRRTTAAEQIRIEDHHEPYISPARFAELQERLRANLPQKSARRPPGKG